MHRWKTAEFVWMITPSGARQHNTPHSFSQRRFAHLYSDFRTRNGDQWLVIKTPAAGGWLPDQLISDLTVVTK